MNKDTIKLVQNLLSVFFTTLFIWGLWDNVVPLVFPQAVASGAVIGDLTFGQAFLVSVLTGALFRSGGSSQ